MLTEKIDLVARVYKLEVKKRFVEASNSFPPRLTRIDPRKSTVNSLPARQQAETAVAQRLEGPSFKLSLRQTLSEDVTDAQHRRSNDDSPVLLTPVGNHTGIIHFSFFFNDKLKK